jgi:deoxycytidine triphosphate deaminase
MIAGNKTWILSGGAMLAIYVFLGMFVVESVSMILFSAIFALEWGWVVYVLTFDKFAEPEFPTAEELGIPEGQRVIILKPGECILCHTEEFIGTRWIRGNCPMQYAATLQTRSSIGRNDLDVCAAAGLIDTGYCSRITMEIRNFSPSQTMVLFYGERIGQVVFHHAGKVRKGYTGSYQPIGEDGNSEGDLKAVIMDWAPNRMLPRLKRDPVSISVSDGIQDDDEEEEEEEDQEEENQTQSISSRNKED